MSMDTNRNGQINLNTVLGSLGTAGALGLFGNLGGIFGGGSGENAAVTKAEFAAVRENTALATENALLKAEIYSDGKREADNKEYNERFRSIEQRLAEQAVHNAKTEGSFALVHEDIKAVRAEALGAVEREAERRCCSDKAIVNYSNATFYPKQVSDVTVGTTTTAQTLYDPIPECRTCC